MKKIPGRFELLAGSLALCSVMLLSSACGDAAQLPSGGDFIVDVTVTPLPNGTSQLDATVSGGEPPFTFSWAADPTLSATNIANPIASPSVVTDYSLSVTDSSVDPTTVVTQVTVNVPSRNYLYLSIDGFGNASFGDSCPQGSDQGPVACTERWYEENMAQDVMVNVTQVAEDGELMYDYYGIQCTRTDDGTGAAIFEAAGNNLSPVIPASAINGGDLYCVLSFKGGQGTMTMCETVIGLVAGGGIGTEVDANNSRGLQVDTGIPSDGNCPSSNGCSNQLPTVSPKSVLQGPSGSEQAYEQWNARGRCTYEGMVWPATAGRQFGQYSTTPLPPLGEVDYLVQPSNSEDSLFPYQVVDGQMGVYQPISFRDGADANGGSPVVREGAAAGLCVHKENQLAACTTQCTTDMQTGECQEPQITSAPERSKDGAGGCDSMGAQDCVWVPSPCSLTEINAGTCTVCHSEDAACQAGVTAPDRWSPWGWQSTADCMAGQDGCLPSADPGDLPANGPRLIYVRVRNACYAPGDVGSFGLGTHYLIRDSDKEGTYCAR